MIFGFTFFTTAEHFLQSSTHSWWITYLCTVCMHSTGLTGSCRRRQCCTFLNNGAFRLNIRDVDETHLLALFSLCWSTHQTTFFNYVIGIFLLIVLSRLANLHGLMRGMFPLQVISYLRGDSAAEKLNREEEAWRCGCRKTKPLRNTDVWCQFFFSNTQSEK